MTTLSAEQNARLDRVRIRASQLFYAGKPRALRTLADELRRDAAAAAEEAARLIEYRAALIKEAGQIADTVVFLDAEHEAVTHG